MRSKPLKVVVASRLRWDAYREHPPLVRPRFPSSFPAVLDEWRCTMREEFASTTFLAVTVAGLVLFLSGVVAFAFD
jgi:hypothetical protein